MTELTVIRTTEKPDDFETPLVPETVEQLEDAFKERNIRYSAHPAHVQIIQVMIDKIPRTYAQIVEEIGERIPNGWINDLVKLGVLKTTHEGDVDCATIYHAA